MFCKLSAYSITSNSDLDYLANVNLGIFETMQKVDPNAVWYITSRN